MVTLEKILSSQELACEWRDKRTLDDLRGILNQDGVSIHPGECICFEETHLMAVTPEHLKGVALRDLAKSFCRKNPKRFFLEANLREVNAFLSDIFNIGDLKSEARKLSQRSNSSEKHILEIQRLDYILALVNIMVCIDRILIVGRGVPKKNAKKEARAFIDAISTSVDNMTNKGARLCDALITPKNVKAVSTAILWAVCIALWWWLLDSIFLQRGPGGGTELYGAIFVTLFMGGLGATIQAYLTRQKLRSGRYTIAGVGGACATLGGGFLLLCATSPDDQITFGILFLAVLFSIPSILGPVFVPLVLAAYGPTDNAEMCLWFYPIALSAFGVFYVCDRAAFSGTTAK